MDEFDTSSLSFESTVRSVYGTPKWGLRARSAIFDFYQNGLIFMVPEAMSVEEMSVDWKIMLMMSISHIVQENQTAFVPLIVPHKQDDWMMQVP